MSYRRLFVAFLCAAALLLPFLSAAGAAGSSTRHEQTEGSIKNSLRKLEAVAGQAKQGNGQHCVQVPFAKPYKCEKEEEVENARSCDRNTEREVCEYLQEPLQEECHRLRKEILQYPCYTKKSDKVCWTVPQQKAKTCKKVERKQKQIQNQRTVRREKCLQKSFDVKNTCYRVEEQTTAYMCYRALKQHCKVEEVEGSGICKEVRKRRVAYECEKTVVENRCTDGSNMSGSEHNLYQAPRRVCRRVKVQRKDTCYKDAEEEIEKPCAKKTQKSVCKTLEPEPDTCEKRIPTLKAFECTSKRHREECKMVDVVETVVDYIDEEEEVPYDCPYIEEAEKCFTYETVVPDVCEKEVQRVEKYSCPKPWYKEVCHIRPITIPHTCYNVDTIARTHTCYDIEYKKACIGESDVHERFEVNHERKKKLMIKK